jgi:putative SOS response-associated peptidase YedK
MCYHVHTPSKVELASIFEEDYQLIDEYDEIYHQSGFIHNTLPVITQEVPGTIQAYQWGLIPHWAQNREKATEIQHVTLNATCENVFEKPSFRESIYKKRCLILLKGFYENRHEGKFKYPYYICPAGKKIFFMGGVYSSWVNHETAETHNTCSIITTPANSLMEKIHNTKKRMPLIFTEATAKEWLNPHLPKPAIAEMMVPCDETILHSYTVSRNINQFQSRDTNKPETIIPVIYPELALFDS